MSNLKAILIATAVVVRGLETARVPYQRYWSGNGRNRVLASVTFKTPDGVAHDTGADPVSALYVVSRMVRGNNNWNQHYARACSALQAAGIIETTVAA